MLANFRYESSWEDFSKTVKRLQALLREGKAHWLIGFLKDFDLYFEESAVDELDEKFINILQEEVLYLLIGALKGEELDVQKVHETILMNNKNVSEDEISHIFVNMKNKYELVKDSFEIDKLAARYHLKKSAVNAKLCDFKYNIYTDTCNTAGKQTDCAIISMACKRKFTDLRAQGIRALLEEQEKNEITFICDEADIDVLIEELEGIKQKMRKC